MDTSTHEGFLAFARVVANADGCPEERPWGAEDGEGEIDGCFGTEAEAQARVDEMNGSEDGEDSAAAGRRRAFAVWTVEGYDTGDGRLLEVGEGTWRETPLPMMVLDRSTHGGWEPGPSEIGGTWERVWRADDGRRIMAEGWLSTDTDAGARWEQMIERGELRFVSIDVGSADLYYDVREVDESGWPIDVLTRFSSYVILTATLVPMPAVDLAVVWLDGMETPAEVFAPLPEVPAITEEPATVDDGMPMEELVSSAGNDLLLPPAEWFEDPELAALTHFTVTDETVPGPDGRTWRRVFGHLAPWGECHIGMPGCVVAPEEPDYSQFATGETWAFCDCDEADERHRIRAAVGRLTLGTSHAARGLTAEEAVWHYDHTGSVAAYLAAGPDDFGIWIAGAIPPEVDEVSIRQLAAADVSGDWRAVGGTLRLKAVLACNVAGFAIPRAPVAHIAASAGGPPVQTSLIAPFGTPRRRESRGRYGSQDPRFGHLREGQVDHEERLARLERLFRHLEPDVRDRIAASLGR